MKTTYKLIVLIIVTCLCSIFIYQIVRKSKPVVQLEDPLIVQNKQELSFLSDSKNYTAENPKVVLNPYGVSPLTALIIFETKDFTAPTITIVGKEEKASITKTFTPNKVHYLPVYGLYADTANQVLLTVNGETQTLTIQTEKLPQDLTLPNVLKNSSEEEKFYFVSSNHGYPVAYDAFGDVRWYFTKKTNWNIKKLQNGHLLVSNDSLIDSSYCSGLLEIDLLGKIYYEYHLPGGYHHDVYERNDGNFLIATNDFDRLSFEDVIVEMDRNTGEIVKTIYIKELLSKATNIDFNQKDWFSNNAIWYDEKTNSITISGKSPSLVINIDYNTEEINWMFGDYQTIGTQYQDYFLKTENLKYPIHQNSTSILSNGDLLLFDSVHNRAVRYRIEEHRNIDEVWNYDFNSPTFLHSHLTYLADNHYLVLQSNDNTIITEIQNDEIVFQMELDGSYYGANKMEFYGTAQYLSGLGERIGNIGITKTSSKSPFILLGKDGKKIIKKYQLEIFDEVNRLQIKGTFHKDDKVEIILDSLFRNKTYNIPVDTVSTIYINHLGLKGRYYLYMKINGTLYNLHQYIEY